MEETVRVVTKNDNPFIVVYYKSWGPLTRWEWMKYDDATKRAFELLKRYFEETRLPSR